MRKLTVLFAIVLAFGLIYGCGEKKEEAAAVDKPAETKMVKDVACGMQIDASKATVKAEYEGKEYSFCSEDCKEKFEKNPAKYVMASEGEHDHDMDMEHGEGKDNDKMHEEGKEHKH